MDYISRQEARSQGLTEFYSGPCKNGHNSTKYTLTGTCTTCKKLLDAKRRLHKKQDIKDYNSQYYLNNRDRIIARSQKYMNDNPTKILLYSARQRARRHNLPCSITERDIVIPTHCPVLGIELSRATTKYADNSPSLDKIVPSKGYVPGNVIVISYRANRIKTDATLTELHQISNFYSQFEVV